MFYAAQTNMRPGNSGREPQFTRKPKQFYSIIEIRTTISTLLDIGANPNTVNADGDSPFLAVEKLNANQTSWMSVTEKEVEAIKAESAIDCEPDRLRHERCRH